MRLILKRKYSHIITPDYIERVVESVIEDPVRIREPRYVQEPQGPTPSAALLKSFALVRGDLHTIHHVKDRGYVEGFSCPSRLRETPLRPARGCGSTWRPCYSRDLRVFRRVRPRNMPAMRSNAAPLASTTGQIVPARNSVCSDETKYRAGMTWVMTCTN